MYVHVRAAVTLFDDLLQRHFDDRIVNHWPLRRSAHLGRTAPDIQLLIDEELGQIEQLLGPGKRQRPAARAHIRSLLAMEAHMADGVIVSKRDVDRVERAIKKNGRRDQVFSTVVCARH